MKKIYFCFILSLACGFGNAQNLVPNGDFEQYSVCPNDFDQLNSALFWVNPTSASPDYYNQCLLSPVNVPDSYAGYQLAHSGGAYTGIALWAVPDNDFVNFREYIEVQLAATLTPSMCYHFEMHVNVADYSPYATDKLGVYFSDTLITSANYYNFPYVPQIVNTIGILSDTVSWAIIEGDYIASGGENYLTIGNFSNDANTNTVLIYNGFLDVAYVYIDDVSLIPCAVGINSPNPNGIQVYPNPFSNTLSIQLNDNEPSEVILRDITAREIMREEFTNAITINTEHLAKGMYIYEVIGRDGYRRTGKVVKE